MPALIAQFGQVELRGEGVALGDDSSPVERDLPAVRVHHGVGAQRHAVRVGIAARDPVGKDEIARPGPGFVGRPTRLPADIKNEIRRARHRHGLGEIDLHPDGFAHEIAQIGIRRGRGDRHADPLDAVRDLEHRREGKQRTTSVVAKGDVRSP